MSQGLVHVAGQINLQATLSSASVGGSQVIEPHHPVTCRGDLALYEDGSLGCEHVTVSPDDRRTQDCLQHSIAILILECAVAQL